MEQLKQSQTQEDPIIVVDVDTRNWFDVIGWIRQNPSSAALLALVNHDDARSQYGYLWVFIGQIIYGVGVSVSISRELSVIFMLTAIFGIIGTASFIVQNWVVQRLAILYDGDADGYRKLHYGRALYQPIVTVTLGILTLLAVVLPAVRLLGAWILVFDLLLATILVQYINNFSYFKAALITGGIYFAMLMVSQVLFAGVA